MDIEQLAIRAALACRLQFGLYGASLSPRARPRVVLSKFPSA